MPLHVRHLPGWFTPSYGPLPEPLQSGHLLDLEPPHNAKNIKSIIPIKIISIFLLFQISK